MSLIYCQTVRYDDCRCVMTRRINARAMFHLNFTLYRFVYSIYFFPCIQSTHTHTQNVFFYISLPLTPVCWLPFCLYSIPCFYLENPCTGTHILIHIYCSHYIHHAAHIHISMNESCSNSLQFKSHANTTHSTRTITAVTKTSAREIMRNSMWWGAKWYVDFHNVQNFISVFFACKMILIEFSYA